MNILFLTHYFPPEVNAPATRTYEHCRRWVEAGNTVIVVTCVPNCPNGVVYSRYRNVFSIELIDGIQLHRIWTYLAPNKGFARRIANYLSYMIVAVVHSLTFRKIDVVVATSPQFFCGWAGVLLHWLRGWPFILEIRDIWPEAIVTVGAMKKSVAIRLLEILEKKMYLSADHIVAVGEGYRNQIISKGIDQGKVSVVINGVDPELFIPQTQSPIIRKKYGGENRFVCSYIGTIGMAHGLEVMLDASSYCKVNGIKDIVFWIVGDGARKDALEERVKKENLDQVVFTGKLSKDIMPSIIASSDCCLVHLRGADLFSTVIPSKIFEIMAMNVPIIMAVKGEAQKIIEDGNAGVIMEPDNPESLLSCINLIRKKGRKAFSGREHVISNFDRNVLAAMMLDIINESINRTCSVNAQPKGM